MVAKVTRSANIARVTLDNPEALNTLSLGGFGELRKIFADLRSDDETRAIILTGQGRAFCAGAALDSFTDGESLTLTPAELRRAFDEDLNALMREMIDIPKPVVVAINGIVAGGGNGLAFCGDVVLAANTARFHCGFVQMLNLVPDAGSSWLLPTLMGRNRALPYALMGEALDAHQAREAGLVWKVVEPEALMSEAEACAARLMRNPSEALRQTRKLFTNAHALTFSEGLDAEREANCHFVATADTAEGVLAFLEKRPAKFAGNGTKESDK